jgi:hypothetical protein
MKTVLCALFLLFAVSVQAEQCTYTQGYWKTHGPEGCQNGGNENAWPVTGLSLGNVVYSDTELCQILSEEPLMVSEDPSLIANGLIILSHQLIAVKLNCASGTDDSDVAGAIVQADFMIGDLVCPPIGTGWLHPATVGSLAQFLEYYNTGVIGPGHCDPTSVDVSSWGQVKALYR